MATPGQLNQIWDSVLELTKGAQERNCDPFLWAIQISSTLNSAQVDLPSTELAHFLVSYICWENHVPITWKFLEKALILKIAPPMLVLALLSTRVIPNRQNHPAAYRLYLELLKRHACSFTSQFNGPSYQKITESVDDVLHLSQIFGLQLCEPGLLVVAFIFSVVWQLVDASLDDEGLLEVTPEKKSQWLSGPQDMDLDVHDSFGDRKSKNHEGLQKLNTTMAIEIIGEFLQNKISSRILFLVCQNMTSSWADFVQRFQVLVANSAALRNSKHFTPEALLKLKSDTLRVLSPLYKKISQLGHLTMASGSLISSAGQCFGASHSTLWLPIDLFLEDAMDGSRVAGASAVEILTGLVKALQAVNCTTWHETFLGLWMGALRLVQRERDPCEGPRPRLDSYMGMLLSITILAVTNLVEEEESELLDEDEKSSTNQKKEKHAPGKRRKDLIASIQRLGDYESLLLPPSAVSLAADQAVAKATMFLQGLAVGNGYCESMSMNDMPINGSGNLWHLIVEACIARSLLDTSAYLWPGYVNVCSNQVLHGVSGQMSAWSSLMKGSPLNPSLTSSLVATPAFSLAEIDKLYEIAITGSDDERIAVANILCGASLIRGWNIQEHVILCIVCLLSPPVPADHSGTDSHLIGYAPMLNILLIGISSVDCVQIMSLHGLVPILAGALMPICELFGSSIASWTLPTGEELSCHAVFSNAFTLLLRLWKFERPPLDQRKGEGGPLGTKLGPEYLLLVRNSELSSFGKSTKDQLKSRRFSKKLIVSMEPIFMDSFPKLKLWYQQHIKCITSALSGLVSGTAVHQIVDSLLNFMFKRINRGGQPLSSTTSGSSNSSGPGSEDASILLKVPAWDILEAVPFVLDAALTACGHGRLSPRELATAEVTRGVWKPVFMNGTDWPSPAANLSMVEQQIKKILAATGVNVPRLVVGGSSPATLPLPLAALVTLTITYRLDKVAERSLVLVGPALSSLASSCPWPCMPIISSLWVQKVKRWSDYLIFSASGNVFHHDRDAVVQLLRSCFTSTLGLSPSHMTSNGGVGALLGHGFGSHFSGGISPVAPGILYLKVHQSFTEVSFMTEVIVSLLIESVREIANSGLPRETLEKLKKAKFGTRYGQVSQAVAMTHVKIAASLAASLIWITGGYCLVQSLLAENLPSWFLSVQGSDQEGGESVGMFAMLKGYALAYFAVICGTFAWGVDSSLPTAKRRRRVLQAHLEFLASALDGKITLGCDWATWQAYVLGFLSLMVASAPKWVLEIDVDVLKRLSKGLRQWNETELSLALLSVGGVGTMGAAAELIIECGV
ncbi:mediator of RNA polymerase II transcription subunit 33B isoform X2 [Tripterygium wilfordii]|uniref:mediator of RNA polymerase II transcription subunit 33B isoform X2 n=1 Tax=Tripterygium wilfordii TaxID=458696 RepID=UPI0018F810F4|nr:mediator of RNA polymerase II transcription subunit 33B isoform X2 [Tripterygium wilfordii]